MNMTIHCAGAGCVATAICTHGSNIVKISDDTGFAPFFNVRNGLETVWLCQDCTNRVHKAGRILRGVFGDQLSYIHMRTIAELSGPTRSEEKNDG